MLDVQSSNMLDVIIQKQIQVYSCMPRSCTGTCADCIDVVVVLAKLLSSGSLVSRALYGVWYRQELQDKYSNLSPFK